MPNISFSLLSLLTGSNGAPSVVAGGKGDDGFASLLEIGAVQADDAQEEHAPGAFRVRRDESRDALAAPVETAALSAAPEKKYVSAEESDGFEIEVPARQNHEPARSSAAEAQERSQARESRPTRETSEASRAESSAAAAGESATAASGDAAEVPPAQTLHEVIESLSALLDLLASLGALVAPGSQITVASAQTQTTISVFSATTVLAATGGSGSNGKADPSLLDKLQALVAQLRALKPLAPADTVLSASGETQALAVGLQNNIATLKQFLLAGQGRPGVSLDEQIAQVADSGKALAKLFEKTNPGQASAIQDALTKLAALGEALNDALTVDALASRQLLKDGAELPVNYNPVSALQPSAVKAEQNAAALLSAQTPGGQSTQQSQSEGSGSQQQNNSGAQAQAVTLLTAKSHPAGEAPQGSFARSLQQASALSVPEQVAFQIKTAPKDGSSKIIIQLDPAELGKLEIKMHVASDGKTGVTIIADNKNTLDMLQRDASALTRALADAGLNTDSGNLNFNLRGGQQEQQHANSHAAANYQKAAPEEEEDVQALNVITRSYVVNLAEGLDIRI